MGLDESQKIFIRNKVRELGSLENVKKIYNSNDSASDYAKNVATGLFLKKKSTKSGISSFQQPRKILKPPKSNSYSKDRLQIPTPSDGNILNVVCIDCGTPIPAARLKINPESRRCVQCQKALEDKNPNNYKRKIDEGLSGSREDHKKLRARDWGAMINRNRE